MVAANACTRLVVFGVHSEWKRESSDDTDDSTSLRFAVLCESGLNI